MWKNYNKYKVMKVFFDNPEPKEGGLKLREISRKIKLAPKSVSLYLKEFEKEGLVRKTSERNGMPCYFAARDCETFKFLKKLDMEYSLKESGLIRFIHDRLNPECIALFGSASRGEDVEGSDIDIFVQCATKKLDVLAFEKRLSRRVNLLFEPDFSTLSGELKNNIINGMVVYGYLKVF